MSYINYNEKRRERKKKNIRDTSKIKLLNISTIKIITTRQIQQHQEMSPTMT
jgi:hypothetical protein